MRVAAAVLAFTLGVVPQVPQDVAVDAPQPFDAWRGSLIDEARTRGYSDAVIQQTISGIEPLEHAIQSDRSQPELTIGFERYFESRATPAIVRRGRELAREHRAVLRRVEQEFGVPRRVVLAIWGMESRYGRNRGRTPVFQALATLAWEPRRSQFFRGELFDAIEMVARGYIEADAMKGSWAGAMGQPQFMPSSYLAHAVDFDGDSRRDIWSSTPDTLASIGNYLQGKGWTRQYTWGREVKVSATARKRIEDVPLRSGTCGAMRDMTEARPLREWQKLGVRTIDGKALPRSGPEAGLVQVQKRAFLVYPNYDAILRYNCAHHYALSVAMLSERLK
jgi:membrane-bound lytic murein transglycosylase B